MTIETKKAINKYRHRINNTDKKFRRRNNKTKGKKEMEQKKIYPYLIDNKRLAGYYELLLDDSYKVKIFSKNKDKEIYNTFLPKIKEYMFWSFNISNKTEFNKLSNDLKGTVCAGYKCNIFEKKNTLVVCFETGICFVITDDEKEVKKLVKYKEQEKMKEINLSETTTYDIKTEKETMLYTYILELYKMIYLNKLQQEIQNPNTFERARKKFVEFTQEIFNTTISEKFDEKEQKQVEKWEKELNLDKRYVEVENQFELLYKNYSLNESKTETLFLIMLVGVVIVIGIINLIIGY